MRRRKVVSVIIIGAVLFSQLDLAWAAKFDPYSYKPRHLMPVWEKPFITPSSMKPYREGLPDVAPSPAISKKADGTVVFYRKDRMNGGIKKVAVVQDKYGYTTYYSGIGGRNQKRFIKNYNDKLYKKFDWNGGGWCTVKIADEGGSLYAAEYERYGLGGKLLERYDQDHLLIEKREYYNTDGFSIFNTITRIWKKYDRRSDPVEERLGARSGPLVAYWRRNGNSWERVEKTYDENRKIVDGTVTVYDRFAQEPQAQYARDGVKTAEWRYGRHGLEYWVDQAQNYKRYDNEFGIRVQEEGVIDYGREFITKVHDWDGGLHLWGREIDILGEIIAITYYDLNDNATKKTHLITQRDVDEDKARAPDDPYKIGLTDEDVEKEIVIQSYAKLWSLKEMGLEGLREFLNIKREEVEYVYDLIQELVDKEKAPAGLCLIASFIYTIDPFDGKTLYANTITVFDENSNEVAIVTFSDPTL